jgi:XTP/dITP diphosphohydrolase
MPIVFATRNDHKRTEVAALLGLPLLTLDEVGIPEDPPETRDTFHGNALQKAHFARDRCGLWTVADDSGLEVDALGGAPGVHSKRFSPEQTGEANNRLLLSRLGDRPDRRARFRCVVALVGPGGEEHLLEGTCEGAIARAPRGDQGFGYDPLFLPDDAPGRTLAELDMAAKNAISHRGRAFAQLPALLARLQLEREA